MLCFKNDEVYIKVVFFYNSFYINSCYKFRYFLVLYGSVLLSVLMVYIGKVSEMVLC